MSLLINFHESLKPVLHLRLRVLRWITVKTHTIHQHQTPHSLSLKRCQSLCHAPSNVMCDEMHTLQTPDLVHKLGEDGHLGCHGGIDGGGEGPLGDAEPEKIVDVAEKVLGSQNG